jgi:drug/metabolite transporter (DMT)-like permease
MRVSNPTVRIAASRDRRVAVGYLLVLVLLWGGNYTWVKIALRDIGPLYLNLFRYGGAVLLFVVIAAAIGRLGTLAPERGERLQLGIVGFLQATVTTTASTVAMVWLDASQVVLIAYSVPVWALLWGALVLYERVPPLAAVGAALGLSGVIVLSDPFATEWHAGRAPGIIAAVVAVNGWALGAVLYRRRAWKSGFWRQVFWQLLVTAVAMAVLAPLFEDLSEVRFTGPMLGVVFYNVIGPTMLGFFFWSQALTRLPAATAGQVMILAPLFGVVQSHLVLGEPLGANLLLATLLVLSGAVLALRAA